MGLLIVVLIFVAIWAWRAGVPLFSTNKQARAEYLAHWRRAAKVELGVWAVSASLAYALTYPAKWPPFIYGLILWGLGLLCSRIVIWLSALALIAGYIYCAIVFYATGHPPIPPVWIFNGLGGVLAAIVIRHPLTWFLASPRTFTDYEVTRLLMKAVNSRKSPPPSPPPAQHIEHNEQAPNHNH